MQINGNEEKIVSTVNQLINLLGNNDEAWWREVLINILKEYHQPESKEKALRHFVGILTGGMGSLSDVILYKNRAPLNEENDELRRLRTELFCECKRILGEPIPGRKE